MFSPDRQFRYTLKIVWNADLPLAQFIGLNPSIADERIDDATVRRCKRFAQAWGYGGIIMTNAFAYRSTDPQFLYVHPHPIAHDQHYTGLIATGNLNDHHIVNSAKECVKVIAAWGNDGKLLNRSASVRSLFKPGELWCFGMTDKGEPKHPLYLSKKSMLQPMVW